MAGHQGNLQKKKEKEMKDIEKNGESFKMFQSDWNRFVKLCLSKWRLYILTSIRLKFHIILIATRILI